MIASLLFSLSVFAASYSVEGKIFKGKATEPLFTQTIQVQDQANGQTLSTSEIFDAKKNVVMRERALMLGDRILSQSIEQLQIGEAYELEREEDKITFRTFSLADGKRKEISSRQEKAGPLFVTGPSMKVWIRNHWDELMEGKEITLDFGVFEVERSLSFTFQKQRELELDGKPTISVKMRPASFFLTMLVEPIFLQFDLATKQLVHFKGRTPLKEKVNNTWKNFDAEIEYRIKN